MTSAPVFANLFRPPPATVPGYGWRMAERAKPHKTKLIETALPLEVISRESAREKSLRHGHPSTLHLWWARRPLAAVRAVLWSSLVDDPSAHPDQFPTAEDQKTERKRLFGILERLVVWENSNDPEVLDEARAEIRASCGDDLPNVLDPFCGGGWAFGGATAGLARLRR